MTETVTCICCDTAFETEPYELPERFGPPWYLCDACKKRRTEPVECNVLDPEGQWVKVDYVEAFGAPLPLGVLRMVVQAERMPPQLYFTHTATGDAGK